MRDAKTDTCLDAALQLEGLLQLTPRSFQFYQISLLLGRLQDAGVGASISMAPQCAGPGMVPMAMVVCYNDRFFQTPNTFLTQTLSIGHGDEHFRLVTERRYLKSDTLIVIGTSVNNMRHIDDDVKSGQFDLMLEPSAGFLLARANRDERRAMRGPVVRAYDVEVMRDLLA